MRDEREDLQPAHLSSLISLLGALPKPDTAVHRVQVKIPSAGPDGAAQVPRAEAAGDHQWEVGFDVAVDGGGADFGAERRRQLKRDATVHRVEVDPVGPV